MKPLLFLGFFWAPLLLADSAFLDFKSQSLGQWLQAPHSCEERVRHGSHSSPRNVPKEVRRNEFKKKIDHFRSYFSKKIKLHPVQRHPSSQKPRTLFPFSNFGYLYDLPKKEEMDGQAQAFLDAVETYSARVGLGIDRDREDQRLIREATDVLVNIWSRFAWHQTECQGNSINQCFQILKPHRVAEEKDFPNLELFREAKLRLLRLQQKKIQVVAVVDSSHRMRPRSSKREKKDFQAGEDFLTAARKHAGTILEADYRGDVSAKLVEYVGDFQELIFFGHGDAETGVPLIRSETLSRKDFTRGLVGHLPNSRSGDSLFQVDFQSCQTGSNSSFCRGLATDLVKKGYRKVRVVSNPNTTFFFKGEGEPRIYGSRKIIRARLVRGQIHLYEGTQEGALNFIGKVPLD